MLTRLLGLAGLGLALAILAMAGPAAAQGAAGGIDIGAFAPMEMRAQLAPHRFTTLSAEIAAKIDRISRRDGDAVRSGEVLLEFDCALQAAQLDKAKAHLLATENTREGQRRLAELNAVGQIELKNSEAEVLKAKADIAYLRAMMDKCRVVAPYDGRIVEHSARAKQFVQAGQPLIELIDTSVLELEFIIPSTWLAWLKPGHAFSVHIEDTGRDYPVRLQRTAARVDPVSQTVKAVAIIDGDYAELVAGMSGQIKLTPPQE